MTVNSITIQKSTSTSTDLDLLFTLCQKTFSGNFAHHFNEGGLDLYLNQVYSREGIKADLINPYINYFIAFCNSKPVGFMKLHLNSNLPDYLPECGMEVEKIYFFPRHQGKGIGRKLMNVAIELALQLNKELIWLGVIDTNTNAIAFYRKMGFTLYDKTRLDVPYFKEELRGMWRMTFYLG